jgi:hypothetical protein
MPSLLVAYASVGMNNTLYLLGVKTKKRTVCHFISRELNDDTHSDPTHNMLIYRIL